MSHNTRSSPFRILSRFTAASCLLVAGLLAIGLLDGSHSRQSRNEASAVGKLRDLTILEKKFAAEHDRGFTCEANLLTSSKSEQKLGSYDPLWFLASGISSGYRFALENCSSDEKGVVVHYEVTAVPVKRGVTGSYAFC